MLGHGKGVAFGVAWQERQKFHALPEETKGGHQVTLVRLMQVCWPWQRTTSCIPNWSG